MTKISIRFYNDREVRAVWDEEKSKWWFSVLDIVGVLNNQDDYQKNRNYWKYLKTKLKGENSELVSGTNQLKLLAPDDKRRFTDVLDYDGVLLLAKSFPNVRALIVLFRGCGNRVDVQGLELDWSCVVWDGDFCYTQEGWSHHSFCGDKWQNINKPERKAFQKNAYRVLLTRARQGMVLVVPEGNPEDPTRSPAYYDSTYEYLKEIGIKEI